MRNRLFATVVLYPYPYRNPYHNPYLVSYPNELCAATEFSTFQHFLWKVFNTVWKSSLCGEGPSCTGKGSIKGGCINGNVFGVRKSVLSAGVSGV